MCSFSRLFLAIPWPTRSPVSFVVELSVSGQSKATLDIDGDCVEWGLCCRMCLTLFCAIKSIVLSINRKRPSLYLMRMFIWMSFSNTVVTTPSLFCVPLTWSYFSILSSFFVYLNLKCFFGTHHRV